MSHSRPESATRHTRATDLAGSHAERMAACPCPYCIPPRIGDLLPDVLAEMRRREARR